MVTGQSCIHYGALFIFKIKGVLSIMPKQTFTAPVKVNSPEFDFLIAAIAKDAEERRQTGGGHPYYAIDLIRKSRLGALRLPVKLGGGGASILLLRLVDSIYEEVMCGNETRMNVPIWLNRGMPS